MSENLWPSFKIDNTVITAPKKLLVEQANYFNKEMKNILLAKVQTATISNEESIELMLHDIPHETDIFIHTFNIIAPNLNNYMYQLFVVRHKIMSEYPLNISFQDITRSDIQNEIEFKNNLRDLFRNPKVEKVIATLYSQSQ